MASADQTDYTTELVFTKTYDDIYQYPLSNSFPFLICVVGAYLLFVLKIGPEFMKNREPYKLKNTILLYNAVQVILSVIFAYYSTLPLIAAGLFPKRCCEEDPEIRQLMYKAFYVYISGKIIELLDTVFFILRKKSNQVSFLHVYHHSSVVIGTWMMYKYSSNQTSVWAGFINSVVHIVMYFYYFMAALGPQYQKYLTWKRHITSFQLFQFVTVLIHQIISLVYTDCKQISVVGLIYVFYSCILFYVLFSNFYNKSYVQPKKAIHSGTETETETITKEE